MTKTKEEALCDIREESEWLNNLAAKAAKARNPVAYIEQAKRFRAIDLKRKARVRERLRLDAEIRREEETLRAKAASEREQKMIRLAAEAEEIVKRLPHLHNVINAFVLVQMLGLPYPVLQKEHGLTRCTAHQRACRGRQQCLKHAPEGSELKRWCAEGCP